MNVQPCVTASLRLCGSCARNPDNQLRPSAQRPLTPSNQGERCRDWYPLPASPAPAGTAG